MEKPEAPKMKRLNVNLPEDEHADLKALAAQKHTTIQNLVTEWVREQMKAERKARGRS